MKLIRYGAAGQERLVARVLHAREVREVALGRLRHVHPRPVDAPAGPHRGDELVLVVHRRGAENHAHRMR